MTPRDHVTDPADVTPRRTPEQTRDLILDAAAECLVEGGFANGRLLSAIARKAGISRPTLYKYGGNVDDIREALVHREVTVFAGELIPRLGNVAWTTEDLLDLLVFVVDYARRQPLLQAALRDIPEVVLPVFTVNAQDTVRWIAALLAPLLQEHIDDGRIPPVDITTLTDVLFRLAFSLILVRGPVDLDDPEALRAYLELTVSWVTDLRTAART